MCNECDTSLRLPSFVSSLFFLGTSFFFEDYSFSVEPALTTGFNPELKIPELIPLFFAVRLELNLRCEDLSSPSFTLGVGEVEPLSLMCKF